MINQKAWHSLNEGGYFVKATDLMPTPVCIPALLVSRFCLPCLPGAGARPEHQAAHSGIHYQKNFIEIKWLLVASTL